MLGCVQHDVGPGSSMGPQLLELLGQQRDEGEEVGDAAVVGDLEDWGVLLGVDGDDDLAAAHAREVLDRAVDSAGDVELGGVTTFPVRPTCRVCG